MWWLVPAVLIGWTLSNYHAWKKAPGVIDQAIEGYKKGTRDRNSLLMALQLAVEIKDKARQDRIIALLANA